MVNHSFSTWTCPYVSLSPLPDSTSGGSWDSGVTPREPLSARSRVRNGMHVVHDTSETSTGQETDLVSGVSRLDPVL